MKRVLQIKFLVFHAQIKSGAYSCYDLRGCFNLEMPGHGVIRLPIRTRACLRLLSYEGRGGVSTRACVYSSYKGVPYVSFTKLSHDKLTKLRQSYDPVYADIVIIFDIIDQRLKRFG